MQHDIREIAMRRFASLAFVLLMLPATVLAAPVQFQIKARNFHPTTVSVAPGTTVIWTNADAFGHTATSDTRLWDSGMLQPGQTFSHTFDKPGSYPYHCAVHTFMTGTVTVK